MTKSKMGNRYAPEVRVRAVRMVFEHRVYMTRKRLRLRPLRPRLAVSRRHCEDG